MPRSGPRTVRRYSDEVKLAAVQSSQEPGSQVQTVAAAGIFSGQRSRHARTHMNVAGLVRSTLCMAIIAACARETRLPVPPRPQRLADAPDQFIHREGVRLRYRDAGRGDPVLLIHGYTGSIDLWAVTDTGTISLADSLARDHRVIALDLRGFGQSTKFGDVAQYGHRMTDDVARLIEHLKLGRTHLIGHSIGALLAASVAERYPDRVASLSLLAGMFFRDSAKFANLSEQWASELEKGYGMTKILQRVFPGMDSATAAGISAQVIGRNDLGALIASIRSMPVLVVSLGHAPSMPTFVAVGADDPFAPQSRELVSRWPRVQHVETPATNHMQIINRPEVLQGIRSLIRATGGAAR